MVEFDIGADDFRRAWPRALNVAMIESSRVIAECQTLKNSLDDTGEKVIKMAQLAPKMMALGQEKLTEAVDRMMERHADLMQEQTKQILEQLTVRTTDLLDQITEAKSDLYKAQNEFLTTFKLRQNDLKNSMLQAEKTISEIKAARQALHIAVEVSKAPISPSKVKGFWASLFS